ncbi:hypothetical protein FA15DRAFT_759627 [Coprinopsis marcescibilis]|uniref:Transcription factor IIIC 90kDa subunit N-terminal domain-containing protein n=1 Tax=Coprinopsis marcescibilis TaxID=230819 RepID=A0A5C3KJG6_COPMA|nr:hypothetical protein FA15DRAFT_759627 [Coprinopsis marcescibilis]
MSTAKKDVTTYKVHTALNVPTAISFPSARCLQWSSDGQVFFVTKTCVHVFTPDHGVNFDNESSLKAPASAETRDDPQTTGWFRTIVQDNKVEGTRWPEICQDWGTVSLGSLDLSITAVTCSPSGISRDGRTVLALLTSNMDLSLWKAGKNYLKGEWSKILDVTPFLISHYASRDGDNSSVGMVLQAQTSCLTWTSRTNYQITPTPQIESSFLVLGSRAGSISFLRYSPEEQTTEVISSLNVSDTWVTKIDASPWWLSSPGVGESYIAYASGNGDVGIVKAIQRLTSTNIGSSFAPQHTLDLQTQKADHLVIDSDSAGVTALQWIQPNSLPQILVVCKPGIVYLWSASTDPTSWSGLRSFELHTQRISNGASSFHPASGVVYLQDQDCLLVTLFDGTFHSIHNVSKAPKLLNACADDTSVVTSDKLSKASRDIFVRTELEKDDKKTMNRINGLVSYDGGATFLWAQDSAVPSDFSYKHDAKHSNTIIVAELWDESQDFPLVSFLERTLSDINLASPITPLNLLRPTFMRLQNRSIYETHRESALNLIHAPIQDHTLNIDIPKLEIGLNEQVRSEFRQSLQSHLFGWSEIISLRMRLSVADFIWKYSGTEEQRNKCGEIAQEILNAISHRNLRVLIRHLAAVVSALSSADIPFILRLILQSALEGSPADLTEEGKALTSLTEHLAKDPGSTNGESASSVTDELNELCPACHAVVPLTDITRAVCPNGHTWRRCSVTTFILSTPWVRTCVGCSRKAFLPPSISVAVTGQVQLPKVALGWVVSELLEAVNQCRFCNNSFVSLI